MKKTLCAILLTVVFSMAFALCASADADWSHPYASVTSSSGITMLEERMLGRVLRANESSGGWFGMTMPTDGDLTISVQADSSFCMEVYVNDELNTSWAVNGDSHVQYLSLTGLKAGTSITWWDRVADSWDTQTSPYMLMASVQTSASASPSAASAAAPEMILNGDIAVGDTFYLGYYEQDGSSSNGREPIEWTILSIDGGQNGTAVVISSQALDCIQYHLHSQRVAWKDASLRMWLNYYFFYQAFNPDEQACVEYTTNSKVVDMVTIPDENMVKKYKLSQTGCDVTDYAKARGVQIGNDNGKGCWWVRMDTTSKNGNTKFVGIHGKVYGSNNVTIKNNGVRPLMTVNLEALRACAKDDAYKTLAPKNYGFAIDRIATRSGPSTSFDEIHTFDIGYGMPVIILRSETTNGTPWVEIEFMYQGEWIRAWTGLKRVTLANLNGLPGDYAAIGSGTVASTTNGWYGPGNSYRVLYTDIPAGLSCQIMGESNGWYMIEYESYDPEHSLTHRCWVPASAIAQ